MKEKKSNIPDKPEWYINRELSWLEFNLRVLSEGQNEALPLAERLKFLAIVSSNLDEFFMVRVAGLQQQRAAGVRTREPSGLTPAQQLLAISGKVHSMVARHSETLAGVWQRLEEHDFYWLRPGQWNPQQHRFLADYFESEIRPVLTPLAVESLEPCPLLAGLQLFVALSVRQRDDKAGEEKLLVIPIPTRFDRFIAIPTPGQVCVATLEDVVLEHAVSLCPGHEVIGQAVFRMTRDADVEIRDDEAADLLQSIDDVVLARRRRGAVRLEISADPPAHIKDWLLKTLGLRSEEVYEIEGLMDAKALWSLLDLGPLQGLRDPAWPPQTPAALVGQEDLWQAIQTHDILLSHPYETFEPVVQLVRQAADDPGVLAIKQTLYRTSGDSPIVKALARAAINGKEVTVLVELKARFDEANNVNWAHQLEDAGCHVIYGIAGLKTHGKALLLVRREPSRIRRYVHLGTGNYNDKTARLYSDLGLLTCDEAICADVASFFNLLTGLSEAVGWQAISVAPADLRHRFIELIDREIQVSSKDRPGLIMAKMNALQDKALCQALYRASQAGVRIKLNVRGICCLRPGVKGLSENIEVTSIVDRYLEHARIYYFANGGHDEVYLASADWMQRNLDRRLEILFPIRSALRRRVLDMMKLYLSDNQKAWSLQANGSYRRVERDGKRCRVQKKLYQQILSALQEAQNIPRQYRPLKRPGDH